LNNIKNVESLIDELRIFKPPRMGVRRLFFQGRAKILKVGEEPIFFPKNNKKILFFFKKV
jgi:hypothetical protein